MYLNEIIFNTDKYTKDKEQIAHSMGIDTLNRLQSMFIWEDLPETIPQKYLELQLQTKGHAFFKPVNDDYYTFTGGLGGEPDAYHQPTIFTTANPALNIDGNYKIGEDGILISNDVMRMGLLPIISRYVGLMSDVTITIRIANIMKRITQIFSGSDASTVESIREYLRQLESGKLGVIEENAFLNDLHVQSGATETTARLTDLIEMMQYLKASLYNDIGLQANYNMKRESINSNEAQLADDALQPLVDNMLKCRQDACKAINDKYNLNISVRFNSAWYDNEIEREAIIESITEGGENDTSEIEGSISDSGNDIPVEN